MKNACLRIILAWMLCAALCAGLTGTALAASYWDDYPDVYKYAEKDSMVDEWSFYNRECTSFVAWCLNSRNGIAFTNFSGGVQWGNACNWGYIARRLGLRVDFEPAVGSVAWWDMGGNGHVAWVKAVDGDTVTIHEYNWSSAVPGTFRERTISTEDVSGFIHFKDLGEGSAESQLAAPVLGSVEYVSGGVLLRWSMVPEAARYGVFRKTNGGNWTGLAATASLSYKDTNVQPGMTYTYTVCCISGDAKRILSAYDEKGLTVTVPGGTQQPAGQLAAPVLKGAENVSGGIRVSWQAVSGAVKYGVFRRAEGENWTGLAATTSLSYTDTSVKPGVTYTYTVCCVSSDGKTLTGTYDRTGLTVTASGTQQPTGQLTAPVLSGAENVSGGIRVSWQAVSGAVKYGVFRRAEGESWTGLAATGSLSYTDTSVKPGVTYTYTVCCVSADGRSLMSTYDRTGITVTASGTQTQPAGQLAAPVLTGAESADGGIRVSWQAVSGAAGYGIFRKADGGDWAGLAKTTATSYTDTSVLPGVTYSYTVCCLTADGSGIASAYDTAGVSARVESGVESGPVIVVQPTDAAAQQGTFASFTVLAVGAEPHYRWEFSLNGTDIWFDAKEMGMFADGAGTETLKVAVIPAMDGFSFRCEVTDGGKSLYSDAAVLRVVG